MVEETYRAVVTVTQTLQVLVEASSAEEAKELAEVGAYVMEEELNEEYTNARDISLDVIIDG